MRTLALLLAILTSLHAQERDNGIISLPKLLSGDWVAFHPLLSYSLTFLQDGTYVRVCNGECGQNVRGKPTFKIDPIQNLVHLSADPETSELYNWATQCRYTYTPLALDYKRALTCDNSLTFHDLKSKSVGVRLEYQGARIVTLGLAFAVTVENSALHTSPGSTSAVVKYTGLREEAYSGYGPVDPKALVKLDRMPTGTRVTVLARTESEERVGGSSNYWYLIKYWDYELGEQLRWVYGQSLQVSN